eukprot:GILJ01009676.1.p1 GENE.GILJ01009676.1~~GILJ01009676.1.p1  ORF type:complete len:155 (-),score=18.13 GILJ01009676.1:306-713(-)
MADDVLKLVQLQVKAPVSHSAILTMPDVNPSVFDYDFRLEEQLISMLSQESLPHTPRSESVTELKSAESKVSSYHQSGSIGYLEQETRKETQTSKYETMKRDAKKTLAQITAILSNETGKAKISISKLAQRFKKL